MYERIILLIDMDCFYCQVEEKLNPDLCGKPMVVVQNNEWRGGGVISVNYAARAKGVTRHMRGDEAKSHCPGIHIVKVPTVRNKTNLTKYREASTEVAKILQRFTPVVERASIDEAYLDITKAVDQRFEEMNSGISIVDPYEINYTSAVGYMSFGDYIRSIAKHFAPCDAPINKSDFVQSRNDLRLLIGAAVANQIRTAIEMQTGYTCSAGIAHNKINAKLACGVNKPNKQTILPFSSISSFFEATPVGKIKGLGGKYGLKVCERLGVRYIGDIVHFSESSLQKMFDEKNGTWLYNICRGIDHEPVTQRFHTKSIGCCKKFPGHNKITSFKTLKDWIAELASEIVDRLQKDISENIRRAKKVVVTIIQENNFGNELASSRSTPLVSYDIDYIIMTITKIIKPNITICADDKLLHSIKYLGINVSKFEAITGQGKIKTMFANQFIQKTEDDQVILTHKFVDRSSFDIHHTNLEIESHSTNKIEESEIINKEDEHVQKPFTNGKSDGFESENATSEENPLNYQKLLKPLKEDLKISSPNLPRTDFVCLKRKNDDSLEKVRPTEEIFPENSNHVNLNEQLGQHTTTTIKNVNRTNIPLENVGNRLTIFAKNVSDSQKKKRKYHDLKDNSNNLRCLLSSDLNEENSFPSADMTADMAENSKNITCEICNLRMPIDFDFIQTHQDYHFAQNLSEQQRIEYRNEISRKTKIKSTKLKEKKTPNKLKNNSVQADITKYLVKKK